MKLKKLLNKIAPCDRFRVGVCDEDDLDKFYYILKGVLNRKVKYFTIVNHEIRIVLKKDLKDENV